jgi:hypothetical protein
MSNLKTAFAPSSWNYGTFHQTNPYYNRKQSGIKRSNSVALNEYGKRKVPDEEKIVTEDYMIMMKEFKAIKNMDTRLEIDKKQTESSINSIPSGKKNLRYQLSFEEWVAVKAKEEEIYKNVKLIKEKDEKNLELVNTKIDQNYRIAK